MIVRTYTSEDGSTYIEFGFGDSERYLVNKSTGESYSLMTLSEALMRNGNEVILKLTNVVTKQVLLPVLRAVSQENLPDSVKAWLMENDG